MESLLNLLLKINFFNNTINPSEFFIMGSSMHTILNQNYFFKIFIKFLFCYYYFFLRTLLIMADNKFDLLMVVKLMKCDIY